MQFAPRRAVASGPRSTFDSTLDDRRRCGMSNSSEPVAGHGDAASTRNEMHTPILPGEGASDYERYLRTDELLSLQKPSEERAHHDELLFQTVHQSSELWLKLATSEVDEAAEELEQDDIAAAIRLLRRAVLCMKFITDQIEMLNQMSPWEYQQI